MYSTDNMGSIEMMSPFVIFYGSLDSPEELCSCPQRHPFLSLKGEKGLIKQSYESVRGLSKRIPRTVDDELCYLEPRESDKVDASANTSLPKIPFHTTMRTWSLRQIRSSEKPGTYA
ncbi:hypothetical protein TNCV_5062971 [Trichonephila clavipes]|nr:hypothetical protein TNCV_5062971 [Trichonephila clavipes]